MASHIQRKMPESIFLALLHFLCLFLYLLFPSITSTFLPHLPPSFSSSSSTFLTHINLICLHHKIFFKLYIYFYLFIRVTFIWQQTKYGHMCEYIFTRACTHNLDFEGKTFFLVSYGILLTKWKAFLDFLVSYSGNCNKTSRTYPRLTSFMKPSFLSLCL